MTPEFHVSSSHDDLDQNWVINQILESYWGKWMTPIQVMRAVDNSMCFGAYLTETKRQVGFLRVVTDKASFSSITDCLVEPGLRGKGIGSALLWAALWHPYIKPTICILSSRDARPFYVKFGFLSVGGDVMKRSPLSCPTK